MKRPLIYILAVLMLALTSCTNPFGGGSLVEFGSTAALDWSNKDFDFGNQQIGSTSVKTFFISNTGTSDATDCGSVTLSDNVNFGITSQTCTTPTLAAGSQCEVVVESHPQSAGEKNLVIDRQCRVKANIISLTNQVKVTAVMPTAQWTPMSHSYGTIQTNYQAFAKTFTLTNSGTSAIGNCGLVSLSNPTDFFINVDNCGLNNLAQGGSCDVVVYARPTSAGVKTTTLSRTCESNYTFSTTTDQMTVTGFDPIFTLYPASYDLGDMYETTVNNAYLYMRNETIDIPVSCTAAALTDSVNFAITYDDCGTRGLTSWDGCSINVQNSASIPVGEHMTNVTKTCTFPDTSVKTVTIPIRANVLPATPVMYVFNNTHDYGNVYVGGAGSDNPFIFYNGGYLAASGCSQPTLSNTTDFSIVTNNCNGADINPSSMCDVTVRALPGSIGVKTGNLSMTCAVGGTITATLQQTALAPAPNLVANTSNINYGSVAVGDILDSTITISNLGPLPGTGCSAAVLSNTTDFTILTDNCVANDVPGNGSCFVTVRAAPPSAGAKTGTLTRTCTTGGSIAVNLDVTGFVAAPNLQWASNVHDFGDVNLGANSSTVNLYLYNSGSANATGCSAPILSNTTDFTLTYESCGTNNLNSGWSSCYAQIRANPQSAGVRTATLSRTCSVGGTASMDTNGIQVNGKLTADWQTEYAGIMSFGAVSIGKTSNTVKYFFRNPNDDILTGCTLASIDNTNDFNIVTNNCAAGSMAAGTACMVEVRGVGVSLGTKTAQLSRSCTETGNKNMALQSTTGPAGKAISIASGSSGTCTAMDNGTVRCWGSARFYSANYPTEVAGVTNAVKVTTADYQACALLSTGEVNCWGWTSYGVLGTPSGGVIPGLNNVVDVVAGKESTCAVVNDGVSEIGVVKCWGGGNPYSPQPVTVIPYTSTGLPIVGAIQVAAGGYDGREFCALLNTKEIACGDFYGTGSYTMAKKAGITDAEEITMTVGTLSYRSSAGQVKHVGYGAPLLVPSSSNVVKLAANNTPYSGGRCAIFDNGTTEIGVIKCWSLDQFTGNPTAAILVPGIDHVVSLSVSSYDLICAVKDTGTVLCRSSSPYYGQLGDLTNQDKKTITKFDLGQTVADASTSATSCALLTNGQIKCWGWADYDGNGGLGDGVTSQSNTPVLVSGISNAIEVKTGYGFACAILATENVKCWGWNWFGKLGNGNSTSSKVPVDVVNLSNVKMLTMGDQMACALINDGVSNIGIVKCWGSNSGGGVLGGASTGLSTPVDMGITGAVKIAADTQTTCAVLNTGGVKCWGANGAGQLGQGAPAALTYTPVNVVNINNAVDITAGEWHFCARLSDETVKCWGYNNNSQIGSSPDGSTPYLIPGLTGVQQVVATQSRTCALLNSGQLKCFGYQVGDLTIATTAKPQSVMNVSNIKKLVPGYMGNLCFINTSDELMCMGYVDTMSFRPVTGF